jgi:hypothetical protein
MGVDLNLILPSNVRVRDVGNVIGRLLGCEAVRRPLGNDNWSVQVLGVVIGINSAVYECANINVITRRGYGWNFLYHFEWSRPPGARGIIMRSTPKNIALAIGVALFFGGKVIYQDHDEKHISFPSKTDAENHANDGAEWTALQERIESVQPITDADIDAAERHAAYPDRSECIR